MADDALAHTRGVAKRGIENKNIERNAKRGEVHTIVSEKNYNIVGFDTGKADLNKRGFKKDLDKTLGPVLKELKKDREDYETGTRTTHPTITVTGHASDSVKQGKGPKHYATERANAVKDYLVKHDVPPDWIQTTTSRETPNAHPNVHASPGKKTAARSATIEVDRGLDNRFAETKPAPPENNSRIGHAILNQRARAEFTRKPWPIGMLYPSVELRGPDPRTTNPHEAVYVWLTNHAPTIKRVARRRNIDARAIAGAIAWEALKNPYPVETESFGRDVIVGKIHLPKADGPGQEDEFWSVAVEKRGYMPSLHAADRRRRLQEEDNLAIAYIGAIMALIADEAMGDNINVRANPGVLTWAYQSQHPWQWRDLVAKKPGSLTKVTMGLPTDTMGYWVTQNLSYLESALK